MSWVVGLFCAVLTLAPKAISQRHNFFRPKIDDHGVRRSDMGQILAQWWRPVASKVALDMLNRAICFASHRVIAIEMTSKGGAFFSVVDFSSCITVAKRPCNGWLKIKPRYTIVRYYVLIQFIYYDGPPTAMNAVLAIIADGGRSIVVIDREAAAIK